MNIYTQKFAFDADTKTPIGIFLNLRKHFTKIALLESNDFSNVTESKSFIGFDPLAEIVLENDKISLFIENILSKKIALKEHSDVSEILNSLFSDFKQVDENQEFCGFFGMFGFEFSHYVERQIEQQKNKIDIPDVHLFLFKNLLVIDHFKNETYLLKSQLNAEFSDISHVLRIIENRAETAYYFEQIGDEISSISDDEFRNLVRLAKTECENGNVFQLVFSRDFSQAYFGDDFEVYRALRKLNPSPYLFYFDFENYRILGSSPEAQLKVTNKKVTLNPIAGTVKKSGNKNQDELALEFLRNDSKENAEHTMLVDLARNDMSKNCTEVKITKFKQLQEYSHVFHLVSELSGQLESSCSSIKVFSDTFPAGTLSGTPKPKALELIHLHEKTKREYYGGAIGFISFQGEVNMAIIIRSILAKNNILHYRTGAGIVLNSLVESELQEVENKVAVLRNAINIAAKSKNKVLI